MRLSGWAPTFDSVEVISQSLPQPLGRQGRVVSDTPGKGISPISVTLLSPTAYTIVTKAHCLPAVLAPIQGTYIAVRSYAGRFDAVNEHAASHQHAIVWAEASQKTVHGSGLRDGPVAKPLAVLLRKALPEAA